MRKQWSLILISLITFWGFAPRTMNAASSSLLITEVLYNPRGAESEREWMEIANIGTDSHDLSDTKIGDETAPGGREGMKRFPEGATLEAGGVAVVAQTAVGFRALYGFNPTYEITDSDPDVPNMRGFPLWADGDLALANDGDEVLLLDGRRNELLDSLNYGDQTTYFAPAISGVLEGQSIERAPATCDTDSAADWIPQPKPTPGQLLSEGVCAAPTDPADLEELLTIGQIQGNTDTSPYVNQVVTFRGIVTGQYEDRNTAGQIYYTLFVQDLPAKTDGDPATSDGIALFVGRSKPKAQIGDQVRVTGKVTEFFGFTELEDDDLHILVESSGHPLPTAVPLTPVADMEALHNAFEPLESMLVTFPPARVVGPTYSGCGLAVVAEAAGAAPITRLIRQSDNDPIGEIVPVLHNSDVSCGNFPNVKTGDGLDGLIGPLIYSFDQYKIVQQDPTALKVTAVPFLAIPPVPTLEANQFSLATYNVENLFDTVDDTGDSAEPKLSAAELEIKLTKIAYAISHTLACPTLIAIQEVEHRSLLEMLTAKLTSDCGFSYAISHFESADARGIDVALLYNPRRVVLESATLRQTCTDLVTEVQDETAGCLSRHPLFSRQPLVVAVAVDHNPYTLIINHFKSKRGDPIGTSNERLAQAQFVNQLVGEVEERIPGAKVIVLGDLNDYELSPPLLELTDNGRLVNVLARVPLEERYSFVFAGASQLIDGVLMTQSAAVEVTAVMLRHVNADYPDSYGIDVSPAGIAYRATDHDTPLVVLTLPPSETPLATAPVPDDAPATSADSPNTSSTANSSLFVVVGVVLVLLGGIGAWLWHRK